MALTEDQKAQLNSELEREIIAQKQAQAQAIVDVANDPFKIARLKTSQKTVDVMETDDEISKKVDTIAKETANTAIETISTENQKKKKQNYFDLHAKDVRTFGLDETSSKDQQVISYICKRAFWFLLMASIGIMYVGAVSVIWEFFTGLTYERIETQDDFTVIKRYGFGWLGKLLGGLFSIVWIGAMIFGTIKFPIYALYISLGLLGFMMLSSIFVNLKISFKWLKDFFKKEKAVTKIEPKTETIIIEEEKSNVSNKKTTTKKK